MLGVKMLLLTKSSSKTSIFLQVTGHKMNATALPLQKQCLDDFISVPISIKH
jgi:hypothetical protein